MGAVWLPMPVVASGFGSSLMVLPAVAYLCPLPLVNLLVVPVFSGASLQLWLSMEAVPSFAPSVSVLAFRP